jgi:hypothetical protein
MNIFATLIACTALASPTLVVNHGEAGVPEGRVPQSSEGLPPEDMLKLVYHEGSGDATVDRTGDRLRAEAVYDHFGQTVTIMWRHIDTGARATQTINFAYRPTAVDIDLGRLLVAGIYMRGASVVELLDLRRPELSQLGDGGAIGGQGSGTEVEHVLAGEGVGRRREIHHVGSIAEGAFHHVQLMDSPGGLDYAALAYSLGSRELIQLRPDYASPILVIDGGAIGSGSGAAGGALWQGLNFEGFWFTSMYFNVHSELGTMYHLVNSDDDSPSVTCVDSDSDGEIDDLLLLTFAEREALGWEDPANFVRFTDYPY